MSVSSAPASAPFLAHPPLPPDAATRLIWLDCEMTGLDPEAHRIIEIATLVTDAELTVLAEGPVIAVHQPGSELAKMDDWNTRQHGRSGLTLRVQESTISEAQATEMTLAFLRQWVPEGRSPMCGNTICQDRRFLARHMPKLEAFFHYRNIDVSTIKELAARWSPGLAKGFVKSGRHLALDDIRDSVAEMKYWREHAMKI